MERRVFLQSSVAKTRCMPSKEACASKAKARIILFNIPRCYYDAICWDIWLCINPGLKLREAVDIPINSLRCNTKGLSYRLYRQVHIVSPPPNKSHKQGTRVKSTR
ncbi:hypothetical protein SAMN05216583_1542 [Selenomonas sp. KH1T6]|nr:hypothetical protein SAMN05216583_1542 [Selenomonas ruminantium]